MLELHRWRQIEWEPSAIVALATSVNGTLVAAARENGSIELWNVAPGSVGWHCLLTIPGKEDAAISSLVWCKRRGERFPSVGRLFSAGLDGFITEWDLETLQPKAIVESHGGSVWQFAAEPLVYDGDSVKSENGKVHQGLQDRVRDSSDNDENSDASTSDSEDEGDLIKGAAEQRVAVGCDDGCLRLFVVDDSHEGMVYRRSFPRLKGRILSVAWSVDGSKIYSGGSDGCIRCWDSSRILELFRITAGIGGVGGGSEVCVWSLLALRDGTMVSGDSTGNTQFWEGKHGTLLQAHAKHGADVLALAASPSHGGVYAAGADGQVVLYQHLDESLRASNATARSTDMMGHLTDKWVFVGSKRTHTHDVRALTVAFPQVYEGHASNSKVVKRRQRRNYHEKTSNQKKWIKPGTAMLISGGSDSKLFTYPADAFFAFHPHDICPAPQRPHIQLANESVKNRTTIFMAQHSSWIDVWRMHTNDSSVIGNGVKAKDILGKRKVCEEGNHVPRKYLKLNGFRSSNERSGLSDSDSKKENHWAKPTSIAPELVARIKCRTTEHISCSAMSGNGKYVAFSDRLKPRLYQVEQQELASTNSKKTKGILKKKLPSNLPAAQSMQFTPDSTRLLLGCHHQILVVDVQNASIVHAFPVAAPAGAGEASSSMSPMKFMCVSADNQWLAATTMSGLVHIFNLETLRHHWSVPVLDGSVATSAIFRPSSSNVLIVSTSTNQIHVLDVEAKGLTEWSKLNGGQMSHHLMEFPGGIIGLSVPPSSTSTSLIVYSSRAMCQIDFSKPWTEGTGEVYELDARDTENSGRSSKERHSPGKQNGVDANGVAHRLNGHSNGTSKFVLVLFKDPILFLGHTTENSLLLVEKPWLEVLRQFPPPVFRHLYGT